MAKKRHKNITQSHSIRIIGGRYRGQKIEVIDQQGLRPTTDRVRETLFNWLAMPIVNAECLDVFAGSGALSFESLSRDARSVDTIECSSKAFNTIQQGIAHLKAEAMHLYQLDGIGFLKNADKKYDVIFLDPPFDYPELVVNAINLIADRNLLTKKGLIYIEMDKKDLHLMDKFKDQLEWHKKKIAGQVCYALVFFKSVD